MRVYGSLWVLMGPYKFPCILIDSNVSLQVLIIPFGS